MDHTDEDKTLQLLVACPSWPHISGLVNKLNTTHWKQGNEWDDSTSTDSKPMMRSDDLESSVKVYKPIVQPAHFLRFIESGIQYTV